MRFSVRPRILFILGGAATAAALVAATALTAAATADGPRGNAIPPADLPDVPLTDVPVPMADPDPRVEATNSALATLSPHVRQLSHDDALRAAFQAYFHYRAARPDAVRKPYLYFVDLGLENSTARGYVFDMASLTLVDGPFHVAHGTGSSRVRNGVPSTFSNRPGSKASSLGLYVAQETYAFSGRANGRAYRSVGLRMHGESGEFNDAARRRGIVAHGAPYVTATDAGRSEGCPAMEQHRAQRLLPLLADGGVVFIYSPADTRWLHSDPWMNYTD
jgi:hypothetical protein